MKISKNLILLFAIVLIAGIFRFFGLSTTPPSLYWDEVSQGYNSYSILKTGFDEHKEFLPIAKFNAFGDYKAPVYIYLDVPFIALFGQTTLAVRFPSALFGTLTVLVAFGLVFELLKNHKAKTKLALLTAFFLSISPWHVQLSRAAYEANIATFFTVLGLYLFFLAKNRNFLWFILSSISFVIGFYAFNAHRIFIPLIVIALFIIYFKDLFVKKRLAILFGGCALALIMLIPFMLFFSTPESKLRFNEVNIFSDTSVVEKSNARIEQENNSLVAKILHNRRVLFTFSYLNHYLDFFNPNYLFFKGDVNPRFSMQDIGQLYLWQLPLLIVGVFMLIKYKRKESVFIITWFILAPIAGATARETPHALRSEMYIPVYEILSAFGALGMMTFLGKFKLIYRKICLFVFCVIILITTVVAIHNYFAHFPMQFSGDWQYGYKQAVQYAKSQESNYDIIAFTQNYGRPYIYVLFYGNISPKQYWEKGIKTRDQFGFYNVSSIGKYQFRNQLIQDSDSGKKVLYVGSKEQIPLGFRNLKIINFLDGSPAFIFATN